MLSEMRYPNSGCLVLTRKVGFHQVKANNFLCVLKMSKIVGETK